MQLTPGSYYGEALRGRKVGGFELSERVYPPGFRTPRHTHKRALFCFVMAGNYTEEYGGRTRECTSSTLLFHPPEELHAEHFHDSGGRSFIIEIESEWLKRLRDQGSVAEPAPGIKRGIAELLARRLYKELVQRDEVSDLIIEGLMMELVGESSRARARVEVNHPPRWLEQAKDLLHERFAEPLKLADIAQSVSVHPVHLAQVFHKSYRCTIGDYVRRLRVERACHDLANSESPLAYIALAAGFCDQSHFNRTFKRLIGIAPSEYRKSIRATKD
ncbi:MAG TPA: AraC family transcriptional regulator [Pyrinomonadaceae bacterium]|nr:AraC family transcriptional regulator [Pyrinomonadaceae bacterium]